MGCPDIFAGTIDVAQASVLGLHLSQTVLERLYVPKLAWRDHHSPRFIDVTPFLVDLDGGKPFRETIREVELGRDDGFSIAVDVWGFMAS